MEKTSRRTSNLADVTDFPIPFLQCRYKAMTQKPLIIGQSKALTGTVRVPGDKSISHRSIMLGSIATGETTVSGLLEGEDVMSTAAAMRAMGAIITKQDNGDWHIQGVGSHGLKEPEDILDMGNSGTSARLLMGLVAGFDMQCTFTGDQSLRKRPMGRVITPLEMMGAECQAREGGLLPLSIKGRDDLLSTEYELPVASAQVKSCVLLAGLHADGITSVIEDKPTRDHTENMLRAFGVNVDIKKTEDGRDRISVAGHQELTGTHIDVPGDPSSAAFPCVAALITEGSEIVLENVGMNERRNGLYRVLKDMGGDIEIFNERVQGGEPVADMRIKYSALKGVEVSPDIVPSMVDEFPILFVAAACANGTTTMRGLEELRVKESDRLGVMAKGLKDCGVDLEMGDDYLIIHGNGKPPQGNGTVEIATHHDHRIAMSFAVLGGNFTSNNSIKIDDTSPILTSFPNFQDLMNGLGAEIKNG